MSLIGRPRKGFNVIAYNAQKQRNTHADKTHYFRDEQDNRTVVITSITGDWLNTKLT